MTYFAAIDFETANGRRASVCSFEYCESFSGCLRI